MSASEESVRRDYSRYDQMSTAELEQLLRLDFQASEDGSSDLDAILYISDLLARRNGPSDLDAVLTACLLGGMVAQAAGVDVWGAIAQWTDETFRFLPVDPRGPTVEEDMAQFQSSLQEWGMADWFPTWHPDGFVPGDLEITELNSSISAYVIFYREDIIYTVVIQRFTQMDHNTGTFEKDDTPVEEYVHNGQTFYILSNIDTLTATSYDGEFMVMIAGSLTREEIKAIIDSIEGPTSS